jgi:hypothetical protein
MKMQLGGVFACVAARPCETQNERLIENRSVVTQGSKRGEAWLQ